MNEEFVKKVYETVVIGHSKDYKNLFENTKINDNTVEYWKNSLELFNNLDDARREMFFNIIKQIIVDTTSGIFGIIDGSSTLKGGNLQISMQIDGSDTEGELQDAFLAQVEEQQD